MQHLFKTTRIQEQESLRKNYSPTDSSSSSIYLFNAMSASYAIFMAKTIKKYKYNKYNKNQQTNKQVILHKIFSPTASMKQDKRNND